MSNYLHVHVQSIYSKYQKWIAKHDLKKKGRVLKGLEYRLNKPLNVGRTFNRFYKQIIKYNVDACMNEYWFFLLFEVNYHVNKYFLIYSCSYTKKKNVTMWIIIKWSRTLKKTSAKFKGFGQIYSNIFINLIKKFQSKTLIKNT
jgi:hypothetical protein